MRAGASVGVIIPFNMGSSVKRWRSARGHCGHPGQRYGSLEQAGSGGSGAKSVG